MWEHGSCRSVAEGGEKSLGLLSWKSGPCAMSGTQLWRRARETSLGWGGRGWADGRAFKCLTARDPKPLGSPFKLYSISKSVSSPLNSNFLSGEAPNKVFHRQPKKFRGTLILTPKGGFLSAKHMELDYSRNSP